MTLTIERDLDSVNMNQQVKCLGQRSFSWNRHTDNTHTHTRRTECSTWTTKVHCNNSNVDS